MTFFSECAGLDPGLPVIRCASAQADYVFGWVVIIVLFLMLFWSLNLEPKKDRFTATLIACAIAASLLSLVGYLPAQGFSYFLLLAVGASALQVFTR